MKNTQRSQGPSWRVVFLFLIIGGVAIFWRIPPRPAPIVRADAPKNEEEVWRPASNFYLFPCGRTLKEHAGRTEPLLKRLGHDQFELEWPNFLGPPLRFHYEPRDKVLTPLDSATQKFMMGETPCR